MSTKNKLKTTSSRRGFLKKAGLVSAAAIGATAAKAPYVVKGGYRKWAGGVSAAPPLVHGLVIDILCYFARFCFSISLFSLAYVDALVSPRNGVVDLVVTFVPYEG